MSFRKYNEGRPESGSSKMPFIAPGTPVSPDPVEMVRQYEEDENLAKLLQDYQAFDYMEQDHYLEESDRVARQLQAEFDSEILSPPHINDIESNDELSIDLELSDEEHRDFESLDLESRDTEHEHEEEEEHIDDIEDEEEDEEHANDIEEDGEIGDEEDDVDDEEDDDDDEVELDDEDDDDDDEEEDDEEEEEDDEEEEGEVDRSRLFPDEIERLPTHISATPLSAKNEAKTCQICMDSYAKGDELRMLPCFHEFHTHCIDPWLLQSTTCPVCRIKVDLTGRVSSFV